MMIDFDKLSILFDKRAAAVSTVNAMQGQIDNYETQLIPLREHLRDAKATLAVTEIEITKMLSSWH